METKYNLTDEDKLLEMDSIIKKEKRDKDFIFDCFKQACKYIQKHPPAYFDDDEFMEQVSACIGSNTYEEGWIQWARYFVDKVGKGEE